jgi:hypothetical protein
MTFAWPRSITDNNLAVAAIEILQCIGLFAARPPSGRAQEVTDSFLSIQSHQFCLEEIPC